MMLELMLDDVADRGAPVRMTLVARNTGSEAMMFGLTGHPVAFDLRVSRSDGTEVWRRLHGTTIPLVLQLVRLDAGEALVFSDEWDRSDNAGHTVPAGRYIVRGVLSVDDGIVMSEPRELTIQSDDSS